MNNMIEVTITDEMVEIPLSANGIRIEIVVDPYTKLFAKVDNGTFSVGRRFDINEIKSYDATAFFRETCSDNDDPGIQYHMFEQRIKVPQRAAPGSKAGETICPTCNNSIWYGGDCMICGQIIANRKLGK